MLRSDDAAELSARDYSYTTTAEGAFTALAIAQYPLPAGFDPAATELMLLLPAGFPDTPPDMFWTADQLTVAGRIPARTNKVQSIAGRRWYRWSRHLNGHWRSGIDDLRSYLQFIEACLRYEARDAA